MQISKSLISYFRDEMSLSVSESTQLIEEGIVDSMGVVGLVEFATNTFEIDFDGDDLTTENLATISAFTKLIESKL